MTPKTDKGRGEPKERRVAIRVRVKPSVKAMAERLAQKEARSMADWLERLIAAEAARRVNRRRKRATRPPS
jgi:predicted HicB family RNase H-like nuclease